MNLCSSLAASMYMDDALTPKQAKKFRAHLKDCRTCSVVLADYRAIDAAIRRAQEKGDWPRETKA